MLEPYLSCKKCKRGITRYTIDRPYEHPNGNPAVRTYSIKFCWGCGYFSIYPNIRDDFTEEILRNRFLIIELIESKELKPVIK